VGNLDDDVELAEILMRRLAQQDEVIEAMRTEVTQRTADTDELLNSMEHMFRYLSATAASVRRCL
jgi:hypothetical protein